MKQRTILGVLRVFCVQLSGALLFSGCAGSDATQWKEFSSAAKDNFAVLMPGVPTKEESISQTDIGPLTDYKFELKAIQGKYKALYRVGYTEYPADALERLGKQKVLEMFVENMINGFNKGFVYKKPILFNGYPGMEYQISRENKTKSLLTCRCYCINNRLYDTIALMPGEQFQRGDATKFLNSFRLLK